MTARLVIVLPAVSVSCINGDTHSKLTCRHASEARDQTHVHEGLDINTATIVSDRFYQIGHMHVIVCMCF